MAVVTVAVEQSGSRSIVFTENGAVDVVESVPRHQSVSTGGTAETLHRTHRHLINKRKKLERFQFFKQVFQL